ncbi:hypothetical protein [Marivita sp.]|uniref:hypothetical protein n=1 Tax=Marivita sp. TaxID=2003365 RepID=UPI002606E513|nr:hypothetical protein [Marivita sp.]
MAHWARNPPSLARVKFVGAVIAVCLVLFAIETWVGWPDWMSLEAERVPNRVLR